MSWQDVETDVGTSRIGRCHWSVTMDNGGGRLSAPKTVTDELGWTSTTALKLQVGTGDEAGSLRLVADTAGQITPVKPHPNAKCLQIRVGRWPGMAKHDQRQTVIRHEVQAHARALILHLPRAQDQAPQPAARPAAATPAAPVLPAAPVAPSAASARATPAPTAATSIMATPTPHRPVSGKVDVTARLMGDPKRSVQMASGTRSNGRTS